MELVPQGGERECGLSVIAMLVEHYHRAAPSLDELRQAARFGVHGLSVAELVRLGLKHSVLLEAYEGSLAEIAQLAQKTWVVLALRTDVVSHYVLARFRARQQVEVYDPAQGVRVMSQTTLDMRYANVALTTRALPLVTPRAALPKNDPTANDQLRSLVAPRLVGTTLVLSVPIIGLMLLSGALMKIIFDVALPYALPQVLIIVGLGFGLAIAARLMVAITKSYLVRRTREQANHALYGLVVARLTHAPLWQREKFAFDEYLQRLSLVPAVSNFLAQRWVIIGHDLLLLLTSAAILIYVAPTLFGMLLVFALMMSALTVAAFVMNRSLLTTTQSKTATFYAALVDLARASGAPTSARQFEPARNRFLKARQRLVGVEQKLATRRDWQLSAVNGVELIAPLVLTLLASQQVIRNELTPGAMLLFLSTSQLFLTPLQSLVHFSISASEHREIAPLVASLLALPPSRSEAATLAERVTTLNLRGLVLQRDRPLKEIATWDLAGNVRLTGANGAGKTTLLRTLSGDYEMPGRILVNGVARGPGTRQLLQERSLYLGEMVALACSDQLLACVAPTPAHRAQLARFDHAALTRLIASVGLGWETKISDGGLHLSSGQRQLTQLLRLFTEKYDVLLIDEALQHIDKTVLAQLRAVLASDWPPLVVEVSHSQTYLALTGSTYAL